MTSLYYCIRKGGPISTARKLLISSVRIGDPHMVRSYNIQGRGKLTVVQLTCDTEVAREFIEAMKRANIKETSWTYDPLRVSPIHPARDHEQVELNRDYGEQAIEQWARTAEAAKFQATHKHTLRSWSRGQRPK